MNKHSAGVWLSVGGALAAFLGAGTALEQYQSTVNQFGQAFGAGSSFPALLFSQPLFLIGAAAVAAGIYMRNNGARDVEEAAAAAHDYGECPACKESIKVGAEKCRFCGESVTWVEEQAPSRGGDEVNKDGAAYQLGKALGRLKSK